MKYYLEETNVQLGASYNVAKQSTESHDKGLEAAAGFMGADVDEIGIFSPFPPPLSPPSFSNRTKSRIV